MKRETFALTILCFILALIYTPPLQAQSTGKALILYFSVPENSGVDASTGASRVVVNNTLYGTTAYVAHMIADAT